MPIILILLGALLIWAVVFNKINPLISAVMG